MAIATESRTTDAPTALLDRGQQLARLEADLFPPDRLDPDDAESDPALWPGWTDADVWTLSPSADDDEATLDLAELVEHQARSYRAWATEAGEMIARTLDELAVKIRLVDATTPAEYEARIEALDAGIRDQYEAIGFENGRASRQGEPAGSVWGHGA